MTMNCFVRVAAGMALRAHAAPVHSQPVSRTPKFGTFGVDLSAQQSSVKPGDDFWSYANGSWADRTTIAADRSSAGYLVKLTEDAEVSVRAILDDMAKNPKQCGAKGKQIGNLYASWMDEAGMEARGTAPLKPYLDRIAALSDKRGVQALFATVGYAGPVGFGIIPDLADPTRYTAAAGQGGLSTARDNYLLNGEKYDGFRKAYRAYVQHILELAAIPNASAKAEAILALEIALAKVQWSPAEDRDV